MPSPPIDSRPAASTAPHRILIFEPDPEGHALEWLEHLMAFVAAESRDTEIWLLAPAAICKALSSARPPGAADRIQVIALSQSACARWWSMRRHLHRSGSEQGFFLMLDRLSLPLALGLGSGGKRLSGI